MWYYDKENHRQGPINRAQFNALVGHGIITPETILESDSGKRVKASQIPDLVFPQQVPPSIPPVYTDSSPGTTSGNGPVFPGPYPGDTYGTTNQGQGNPSTSVPPADTNQRYAPQQTGLPLDEIQYITNDFEWKQNGGFLGWLADCSFSRIGFPYRYRKYIRASYISVIAILSLLALVAIVGLTIGIFSDHDLPLSFQLFLSVLVFIWVLFVYVSCIVAVRNHCERRIIKFHHLYFTTRAAKMYLESRRHDSQ